MPTFQEMTPPTSKGAVVKGTRRAISRGLRGASSLRTHTRAECSSAFNFLAHKHNPNSAGTRLAAPWSERRGRDIRHNNNKSYGRLRVAVTTNRVDISELEFRTHSLHFTHATPQLLSRFGPAHLWHALLHLSFQLLLSNTAPPQPRT